MNATNKRIVVGVDGSEPAERALEWGAREAELRGATLEVVTVWSTPVAYSGTGVPAIAVDPSLRSTAEPHAQEIVDHAARRGGALGAQAVPRAVEGHASNVLVEMSDGAELLVVGSRGRGGFGSLLLGSVSAQCAHHAACPVAIIH